MGFLGIFGDFWGFLGILFLKKGEIYYVKISGKFEEKSGFFAKITQICVNFAQIYLIFGKFGICTDFALFVCGIKGQIY